MSWVQQTTSPVQQQQYQQQPQLHTQHPSPPTAASAPAVPLHPSSATASLSFMGKSSYVSNLSNSMRQIQNHANGGSSPYSLSSPPPPLPLQQQQVHAQQQQQSHLNNQQQHQQQHKAWHQLQQNYLPQQTKMMQSSAANNWQQQQQQPQQSPSINMYQQQPVAATSSNWQQPELQAAPIQQHQYGYQQQPVSAPPPAAAATYGNFYNQTPPQQQQQPLDAAAGTFYQQQQQQQPPPSQQQQPQLPSTVGIAAHDYFDNNINHNNNHNNNSINKKNDGWGDWDWNDNSNVANNDQQPQQHQQIHQQQQQQHLSLNNYNAKSGIIEDSFGTQSSDSWNWGVSDDKNANANAGVVVAAVTVETLPPQTATSLATASSFIAPLPPQVLIANDQALQQQQQLPQTPNSFQVPQHQQQQKVGDFSVVTSKKTNVAAKPPTSLPLMPEISNENYNSLGVPPSVAAAAAPTNNIPNNSVYLSQAKPVARPSRQYASPPGGNTPSDTPESALIPPQGFQNEEPLKAEVTASIPQHPPPPSVTPLQHPPSLVMTPTTAASALPPPPPTSAAAGGLAANPFKRAGTAQHHRASAGLINTAATISSINPPSTLNVPPPPADFANPMPNSNCGLLEPDNSEILHENQEVLAALTLPLPATQIITMPGTTHLLQPPNDDRNQYLQTSHLSENPDERELNLEADTSLPPPGLSRLVLGQPELEASQQRMVTGTEADSIVSANMHMEERHADGEDTSVEQQQQQQQPMQIPMMSATQRGGILSNIGGNIGALVSSSTNIDIITDRNLYLVPGESNIADEQRVVTGVENGVLGSGVANANTVPQQIISELREIELDGENLEDQQTIASVSIRNEPPLEGAASTVTLIAGAVAAATPGQALAPSVESERETNHHHHQSKTKDHHSNVSTGNDESDQMQEHHYQHHGRYSNNNKSRKHVEVGDNKLDRQQRKGGEKQRSVDRFESEEEEESAEYSSDRERERERRRGYREGAARSDRGGVESIERDIKEKRRREKRESGGGGDRVEKQRGESRYYRGLEAGSKGERRSQRYNRYDAEEEDTSMRHESNRKDVTRRSVRGAPHHPPSDDRSGRSDRSDRDYDDYNRRYRGSRRGVDAADERGDRNDRRGGGYADEDQRRYDQRRYRRDRVGERDDYDTLERRRRDKHHQQHRGDRGDRGERVGAEYEEYRKQSSRNARESDVATAAVSADPRYDPRQVAMYGGYPPAAYGYDPYAYYYEQMARTNPQAYSKWYKKYYGSAAASAGAGADQTAVSGLSSSVTAATDGRESVHSGRSSTHNEKERSGNLSLRDADANNIHDPDPQRLTPRKFISEHAIVSLSAGILVTVKPKYTTHGSISNVVKLHRLGANDATRQLFQTFPGPLVRGLTHKKTIIEFCEEQIRLGPAQTTIYAKQQQLLPPAGSGSSYVDKYKASYTLMWNLLILLLRQNGMVVGTDIAELLLKNQQQFSYQISTTRTQTPNSTAANSLKTHSKSGSDATDYSDEDEGNKSHDVGDEQEKEAIATADNITAITSKSEIDSLASVTKSNCLTESEVTEKFRNYLLYGNVNEALDWATDNNLWGHALFLASKVDRRSHANVLMKFANKLSLNDPLQTLYQLMSGRTPSSVTSVQDEKWGDWRPHLSMILSNTSQKPELDRKAITTLGDSLFNRGDLYAAHFCYLMAQVSFGRYQDSATQETALQQTLPKLVLLGSSHYKNFREFATNEAIMMTEIYEYACSLNVEKFSLIEFQPYKYLLATRMLDYGYHLRSLMYMEQIALHVQRDLTKYEPSFINKVYELADRLKYYDPVLEKTVEDQQQNMDGNLNNSMLPSFEEQKWLQDLRGIAMQHMGDYTHPAAVAPFADNHVQNQIDQQFAEINKQFNELTMQYNNMEPPTTAFHNTDSMQQQPQMHAVPDNNNEYYQQQQPAAANEYNQQDYMATGATQPHQQPQTAGVTSDAPESLDPYANYVQQQQQPQHYLQPDQQQNSYYDHTQQQNYNSIENTSNAGSYDYWGATQLQQQPHQQQHQEQHIADESATGARPTISMPKSKSYDSDDDRQQQKQQRNTDQAKKNAQQQRSSKGGDFADLSKGLQQSNQNSGWFGGIWNKLSMKPKNQMILPDDKNPSIVWDPEKKRWVNTDGGDGGADGAGEESIKPPPKMSDIVSPLMQQHQQQQQLLQQQPFQQQQQQQQQPVMDASHQHQYGGVPMQQQPAMAVSPAPSVPTLAVGAPMQNYSAAAANTAAPTNNATTTTQEPTTATKKTPSLQSNMFKMQRNRTLKNSYVDVFNPSGAPMSKAAENVLAPALPPAAVPQGGFFIPGAAPAAVGNNDTVAYQQQQQQQPQQDMPQFYNPNQFAGAGGGGNGVGY